MGWWAALQAQSLRVGGGDARVSPSTLCLLPHFPQTVGKCISVRASGPIVPLLTAAGTAPFQSFPDREYLEGAHHHRCANCTTVPSATDQRRAAFPGTLPWGEGGPPSMFPLSKHHYPPLLHPLDRASTLSSGDGRGRGGGNRGGSRRRILTPPVARACIRDGPIASNCLPVSRPGMEGSGCFSWGGTVAAAGGSVARVS